MANIFTPWWEEFTGEGPQRRLIKQQQPLITAQQGREAEQWKYWQERDKAAKAREDELYALWREQMGTATGEARKDRAAFDRWRSENEARQAELWGRESSQWGKMTQAQNLQSQIARALLYGTPFTPSPQGSIPIPTQEALLSPRPTDLGGGFKRPMARIGAIPTPTQEALLSPRPTDIGGGFRSPITSRPTDVSGIESGWYENRLPGSQPRQVIPDAILSPTIDNALGQARPGGAIRESQDWIKDYFDYLRTSPDVTYNAQRAALERNMQQADRSLALQMSQRGLGSSGLAGAAMGKLRAEKGRTLAGLEGERIGRRGERIREGTNFAQNLLAQALGLSTGAAGMLQPALGTRTQQAFQPSPINYPSFGLPGQSYNPLPSNAQSALMQQQLNQQLQQQTNPLQTLVGRAAQYYLPYPVGMGGGSSISSRGYPAGFENVTAYDPTAWYAK